MCQQLPLEIFPGEMTSNAIFLVALLRKPLNDANHDLEVNFIDCIVRDKKGKMIGRFSWVTDIWVTLDNVYELARGGRAKWRIENETFNTLKNQDYHFEHTSAAKMLRTVSSSLKEDEKKDSAMGEAEESFFRILHRVMGRYLPVDDRE